MKYEEWANLEGWLQSCSDHLINWLNNTIKENNYMFSLHLLVCVCKAIKKALWPLLHLPEPPFKLTSTSN